MRLLLSHDKLITSDTTALRVYALDGDQPALLASAPLDDAPNPYTIDRDGYPISASASARFAQLRVTGGEDGWWDAAQRVELRDLQLQLTATVPLGTVLNPISLALSPDASRVAGNLHGAGVAVWDVASGERVVDVEGDISSGVCFSPCGRYLVSGDTDQGGGELYLIDLEAEGGPQRLNLPRPICKMPLYDSSYASAWSPDGALVAVSGVAWGLRGVVVYDPQTRAERWSHDFPMAGEDEDEEEFWSALDVAFAAGGALVVAGVEAGALRVWRAADGQELDPLACEGATSARFVVDDARRCVWIDADGQPARVDYPADWP
jgi:WD40 repeat protein